jgi:pimeloyl-ACP methyl ester carboxylesterase
MSKEKQKSLNVDPDFHSITTGQKLFSTEGESEFSMMHTPSTPEHFDQFVRESGRKHFVDIYKERELNASDIARMRIEYDTPHILESGDGSKVEIRRVNEAAEGPGIAFMTPWSTDANWENSRGVVEALALTYPDIPVMYINVPGMGESSGISKGAKRMMVETGSYRPMAEQVARVLKENDVQLGLVVGASEGGRLAIPLAELLGAKRVVTLDPPGLRDDWSFLEFAKHFSIDEGKALKGIHAHSPDQVMVAAMKKHDEPYRNKSLIPTLPKRQLLPRAIAMGKDGLIGDIQSAAGSGVEIVDYRAGASTISDIPAATELASKTPGYNAIVLKDAPHSFTEVNPFSISLLVEQAQDLLDSRANPRNKVGAQALLT